MTGIQRELARRNRDSRRHGVWRENFCVLEFTSEAAARSYIAGWCGGQEYDYHPIVWVADPFSHGGLRPARGRETVTA